MLRRLITPLIICIIVLSLSIVYVSASTGEEHDKQLEHVLLGENGEKELQTRELKDAINALEKAAYLTLDLTKDDDHKKKGQTCLDALKSYGVPGLPRKLEKISFSGGGEHREMTHMGWDYNYSESDGEDVANWKLRKKILLNTSETAFDFGSFSNRWKHSEKCNSFCAIVYYTHVLGDCAADTKYKTVDEKINLVPLSESETTGIIQEMRKHFKILFEDQKSTYGYDNLMSCLDTAEKEVTAIVDQQGGLYYEETFQDYRNKAKQLLIKDLPLYVPPLLEEEEFFTKVNAKAGKSFFQIGASLQNQSGDAGKPDSFQNQGASW